MQQPLPAAWLSEPSPFQPNIQQGNYLQMPLPMEELPTALSSPLRQPSFGQVSSTPSDVPLRGNQAQLPFALPLQNGPVPPQQGQQPQHSLVADAVPGTASHMHSQYSLPHTPPQTSTRLRTDFTSPMTPQPAQSAEPRDYGTSHGPKIPVAATQHQQGLSEMFSSGIRLFSTPIFSQHQSTAATPVHASTPPHSSDAGHALPCQHPHHDDIDVPPAQASADVPVASCEEQTIFSPRLHLPLTPAATALPPSAQDASPEAAHTQHPAAVDGATFAPLTSSTPWPAVAYDVDQAHEEDLWAIQSSLSPSPFASPQKQQLHQGASETDAVTSNIVLSDVPTLVQPNGHQADQGSSGDLPPGAVSFWPAAEADADTGAVQQSIEDMSYAGLPQTEATASMPAMCKSEQEGSVQSALLPDQTFYGSPIDGLVGGQQINRSADIIPAQSNTHPDGGANAYTLNTTPLQSSSPFSGNQDTFEAEQADICRPFTYRERALRSLSSKGFVLTKTLSRSLSRSLSKSLSQSTHPDVVHEHQVVQIDRSHDADLPSNMSSHDGQVDLKLESNVGHDCDSQQNPVFSQRAEAMRALSKHLQMGA